MASSKYDVIMRVRWGDTNPPIQR